MSDGYRKTKTKVAITSFQSKQTWKATQCATGAKRGKTCNRRQALKNMHSVRTKRGKTWN